MVCVVAAVGADRFPGKGVLEPGTGRRPPAPAYPLLRPDVEVVVVLRG